MRRTDHPNSESRADARPAEPKAEAVRRFLLSNENFFLRHPDLLEKLALPRRDFGDGVPDFHAALVERQRARIGTLTAELAALTDTSRRNLDIETRVHTAVLHVIAASDWDGLAAVIANTLPTLLDVLSVEIITGAASEIWPQPTEPASEGAPLAVRTVDAEAIEAVMGINTEVLLPSLAGTGALFPAGANEGSPLQSAALVRLNLGHMLEPAVLSYSSGTAGFFSPNQAVDQLRFVSAAVEIMLRRLWLEYPR
jgi:uncharacterized protein YigA (DUF484 family)